MAVSIVRGRMISAPTHGVNEGIHKGCGYTIGCDARVGQRLARVVVINRDGSDLGNNVNNVGLHGAKWVFWKVGENDGRSSGVWLVRVK